MDPVETALPWPRYTLFSLTAAATAAALLGRWRSTTAANAAFCGSGIPPLCQRCLLPPLLLLVVIVVTIVIIIVLVLIVDVIVALFPLAVVLVTIAAPPPHAAARSTSSGVIHVFGVLCDSRVRSGR
jgi:hypothetical protein